MISHAGAASALTIGDLERRGRATCGDADEITSADNVCASRLRARRRDDARPCRL